MKDFTDSKFDQERALYGLDGPVVRRCRFEGPADGESALKECSNVTVYDSIFDLRYPLWHVSGGSVSGCEMTENCRAPLWYCSDIRISSSRIHGVKAVRECDRTSVTRCDVSSPEFGWKCRDLVISDVALESEYPFLDSSEMSVSNLSMNAKYSFQYVSDCTIRDSALNTKDAFWHSRDVTVMDSVVNGEYLGWYSENLRLVRCRISGTQPLCYCRGLVLEDCTMEGCDLSFERSEVNATIKGGVLSVKNPLKGSIVADDIGDVVLDIPEAVNGSCAISVRGTR